MCIECAQAAAKRAGGSLRRGGGADGNCTAGSAPRSQSQVDVEVRGAVSVSVSGRRGLRI